MAKEDISDAADGAAKKPAEGKLTQEQCAAQNMVAMERFAGAFERSARRWEVIVYPSMLIFTLFAAYGFYQIYMVTRDMRVMVSQVEPQIGIHMTRLTLSLQQLTDNISQMSSNINKMQKNVAIMSTDMKKMSLQMDHLQTMDSQMLAMNRSMELMAANTNMMRWDMAKMNRSFGKPMNFMNIFMPW